jgi:ethanolamine utilization microcompartment shell protein EutS
MAVFSSAEPIEDQFSGFLNWQGDLTSIEDSLAQLVHTNIAKI